MKRPIQIQSEFFERVWTNSDVDAVFEYFDGEANGLGTGEPMDPVGYIDFYHALSSVVKDVEFELPFWVEKDNKLYLEFLMKARARRKDKAIFWRGSAHGFYRNGKIAGGENFLDFVDLFSQLELVPEETVELGLAGEEILQIEQADDTLGREFRRLFWPQYRVGGSSLDTLGSALPSNQELEVLFGSATFGMVTTDETDRVLDSNKHFRDLIGEPFDVFSDLVVGKGAEAEKRAREALLSCRIPSYRILLHLKTSRGPARVWASAVVFRDGGRPPRILRSIERDDLIDDLLHLQEAERRLLSAELNREVLAPILELWSKFSVRASNDPALRVRCLELAGEVAGRLREKISGLRNPILEGIPLSEAWPEVALDSSLDQVGETASLIVYRLVGECLSYFGSSISELRIWVDSDLVIGSIPVTLDKEDDRLHLLRNLCDLVGGRLWLVSDGSEPSLMSFQIPTESGGGGRSLSPVRS